MSHFAIGADELAKKPDTVKGAMITCPKCGKQHELKAGKTPDGKESTLLLFYSCGKDSYLGALNGKLLV